MADVIAECMSDSVAAVTRAAKVEAFNSWSAWRTSAMSKARTAEERAVSPSSILRKSSACVRPGSGGTKGLPSRSR